MEPLFTLIDIKWRSQKDLLNAAGKAGEHTAPPQEKRTQKRPGEPRRWNRVQNAAAATLVAEEHGVRPGAAGRLLASCCPWKLLAQVRDVRACSQGWQDSPGKRLPTARAGHGKQVTRGRPPVRPVSTVCLDHACLLNKSHESCVSITMSEKWKSKAPRGVTSHQPERPYCQNPHRQGELWRGQKGAAPPRLRMELWEEPGRTRQCGGSSCVGN